jgi:hypothetical protein
MIATYILTHSLCILLGIGVGIWAVYKTSTVLNRNFHEGMKRDYKNMQVERDLLRRYHEKVQRDLQERIYRRSRSMLVGLRLYSEGDDESLCFEEREDSQGMY